MTADGVLVVDKPGGMTSHDVVDRVRRIFGTKKVGHAGTLDPDATGILVLGLGSATRLLSFAQAGTKRYRAVAAFGTTTTTQDASGDVLETKPVDVDAETVRSACREFVGEIEQIPPMVSAVKVGGERLYRKARRGEEVERPARRVTIHELDLVDFHAEPPEATLDVRCSPGTYIRTLVHDLGQQLGCGAHLKTLRRTESSGFSESDAVALDAVSEKDLRPTVEVVRSLRKIVLDPEALRLVSDGRPLDLSSEADEGERVALLDGERLVAIYSRNGDRLVADKVLAR